MPSGWRNELLDFSLYGGPGIKYAGQGKLPPMIKDLVVHYFYLLGLNPNDGLEIPEDYEDRNLEELAFIPPPPEFTIPSWATPFEPEDSVEDRSYFITSQRQAKVSQQSKEVSESNQSEESGQCQDVFIAERPPAAEEGRLVLRLTKSRPQKRRATSPTSPPASAREPSSPPSRPCKRGRPASPSPRPSPAAAPQASSTMRSEYDLVDKSPIVLRLNNQSLSKLPKKAARLPNTLGSICDFCAQEVTAIDIKTKNGLVACSSHRVHYYCMQECIEGHSDLF